MTAVLQSPTGAASTAPARPGLAFVSEHVTPYRVHLFGRIAREIPELAVHAFFVETGGELEWDVAMPPETHPIAFEGADATLSPRLVAGVRKAKRMLAEMKRRDVRAVVVGGYHRPSLLALLVLAPRAGLATFLRADSILPGERSRTRLHGAVKRLLVPWLLRRCSGVLVMGRLGDAWARHWGAPPERTFRMPYEPDHEAFAHADEAELDRFRRQHALVEPRTRFLFVGRLAPIKRVDVLVDAFVRIADDAPDGELVIVGRGPLEAALRARVPEALRERVRFLGFLNEDDVRRALHACDVFVLPSAREPWGVVVNEAVAAGRPVIATEACGAAAELVQDGVSGRIVPVGDVPALADALRELARPDRRAAMARGAGEVLARWRREGDPVEGLRRALTATGVIHAGGGAGCA